jgi:hypothetical protein
MNEIDYTPRMVEDEVMVEVGGFFSSLGKLKARVDAAYEKHGDISISGDYREEYFIPNPIRLVMRLETEEEVLDRVALEIYDREHAVDTINSLAKRHGLSLKWE